MVVLKQRESIDLIMSSSNIMIKTTYNDILTMTTQSVKDVRQALNTRNKWLMTLLPVFVLQITILAWIEGLRVFLYYLCHHTSYISTLRHNILVVLLDLIPVVMCVRLGQPQCLFYWDKCKYRLFWCIIY